MKTRLLAVTAILAALTVPAAADEAKHNLTVHLDPSGHVETGWRFELPTGLTLHGEVGFVGGGDCTTDGMDVMCNPTPTFATGTDVIEDITTASASLGYTRTVGPVDVTFAAAGTYAKHPSSGQDKFSAGVDVEVSKDRLVAFVAWNHAVSEFTVIDQLVLGDDVRVGVGFRF